MKKRKMLSFILMGLFLLQSALPVAASEPLTEEESLIAELNQGDTLELLFFGKTIWNDEEKYEDLKDIISEMLLEFLINTGAADEETQSEEIKDLIEYAYEIGISRMFWISTRVIVTPHRSASKWIFVSSSIHAVYLFQQLRVDRFSRREGVIQSDLGNNVTKRSLR